MEVHMPDQRSIFDPRRATRAFTAAHEFWYRMTNGFVGGWAGAPILLLTTTGRKSGEPRTTPLLFVRDRNGRDRDGRDRDDLIVIASYGGSDEHPQWWRNLLAKPEAEAQVFGERRDVVAHEATGDERQRLWRRITMLYPVYRFYESRTSREIPVVVLRPAPNTEGNAPEAAA
jgi:deazaflavin-dependent oxidoreductase (nitroreductase family)